MTQNKCRQLAAILMLAVWASCGGAAGRHKTRAAGQRYKITIVEAALASHRPDGSAWHVQEPDGSTVLLGGLIGLALGYPMVGLAAGEALQGGAREYPPNPYVELKIGPDTFKTLPAGPTLAPHWHYPIAVNAAAYHPAETVIIMIRDGYDKGVISQTQIPLGALLSRPLSRFFELGSVITLDVAVARLPEPPAYQVYELEVPADRSADELVEAERAGTGSRTWRRVPLLNGDMVRIRAGGQVCPSSWDAGDCFDAHGAPGRWQSYNYPEFGHAPHAALVGVYADRLVLVGTGTLFRAERSGWLMLFVNDTDEGNNRGSFDVIVEVNPPDAGAK